MTETTEEKNVDSLTKQEQNWMMMTILQIPWHHANKIEEKEDRDFLIEKAEEALRHMQAQQQMKQQQEQSAPSCQPQK